MQAPTADRNPSALWACWRARTGTGALQQAHNAQEPQPWAAANNAAQIFLPQTPPSLLKIKVL